MKYKTKSEIVGNNIFFSYNVALNFMKNNEDIWFICRKEWLLAIKKRENTQLKFTYKVNKCPKGVMPMEHPKGVNHIRYKCIIMSRKWEHWSEYKIWFVA